MDFNEIVINAGLEIPGEFSKSRLHVTLPNNVVRFFFRGNANLYEVFVSFEEIEGLEQIGVSLLVFLDFVQDAVTIMQLFLNYVQSCGRHIMSTIHAWETRCNDHHAISVSKLWSPLICIQFLIHNIFLDMFNDYREILPFPMRI